MRTQPVTPRRTRRAPFAFVVVAVIGVGLAAAPVAFQMFSRAPGGGEMLDDFRRYMDPAVFASFHTHLDRVDSAVTEIRPKAAESTELAAVTRLVDAWPETERDLRDLLATMGANVERFEAVDALPPFALFPWFFVAPGLLLAAAAGWGFARHRSGRAGPGPRVALIVVGLGLVAAPLVFQMFTRAPAGEQMIDEFRPLMTRGSLTSVQQAFVVIGAGEGELRLTVLPGVEPGTLAASEALVARWPAMAAEMAPMIGAMADNLGRFAGIDALPPFGLFPWFFVIPGLAVVAIAGLALRPGPLGHPVVAPPLPTENTPADADDPQEALT